MFHYVEPTSDECTKNARVIAYVSGPRIKYGYACWYPQMGGYVSRAVVLFDEPMTNNDCFDAIVWHDGEFPFSDSGERPKELHHCSAEQFVRFGNLVGGLQERHATDEGGE